MNCGHAAIAAVMAVSCAFGYVLRGIIDREKKDNREWFLNGLSADHDRWEDDPEPTKKTEDKRCSTRRHSELPVFKRCSTCRHSELPVLFEPCLSCDLNCRNWEAKA